MTTHPQWARGLAVAAFTLLVAAIHGVTPAGPHATHWIHVVAERAYYVPILLAAAWWGIRGALAAALGASAASIWHVLADWQGWPMVQVEQLGEISSFWVLGVLSALLMSREQQARQDAERAHEETLGALARSLELREKDTAGHSQRVRDYALLLAHRLGVTDRRFLRSLALGAFLHDVGKIGIPDRVLLKEGPLDDAEQALIRTHPRMGAELIGDIAFLQEASAIVLSHHERFDGHGYPRALARGDIPLAARIFAVADVFDALTTIRPYHKALSWQDAARQIAGGRGSHFDPDVVDAFLEIPSEDWARIAVRTGALPPAEARRVAPAGEKSP
jgi:putative nucleotidyltransferase with HDIG domain